MTPVSFVAFSNIPTVHNFMISWKHHRCADVTMRHPFLFILVAGLAALHALPVDADLADAASNVRQIVAHRGASTERPECTLAALRRAFEVGATAVEIDVRTSRDGQLFLLHDATLDRTTDGKGPAGERSMAELKQLDAGSWFDPAYRGERIPTLREALQLCCGRIDVLLDLKEQGAAYADQVAREVRAHGDPERTILGVRSVEQARQFRQLLPASRQLGMIAETGQIEAFVQAGVEAIRLWPRWLADGALVKQVRHLGVEVHLNGATGEPREILPLLMHQPFSLLVDDPARLVATLDQLQRNRERLSTLDELVTLAGATPLVPWISRPGAATFLNRDYQMLELPKDMIGLPRVMFQGGSGERVVLKFKQRAVLFAALEYNDTGAWSFADGQTPLEHGWRLLRPAAYRGTSNATLRDRPHFASIYYFEVAAGEEISELPPWWLCLAIVDIESAAKIAGFEPGVSGPSAVKPSFSYQEWATRDRSLAVPQFESAESWADWQNRRRGEFYRRLVFPYQGETPITAKGDTIDRGKFYQQEYEARTDQRSLFRFFRLIPKTATGEPLPTIVCFMGHGKVGQILEDRESYQHACAARFAESGYLVYALENVGMEPDHDTHLELDRLLRLDGYCWYSLLFAHQRILLQHVFADQQADAKRVGVTGVSTGGLLALSAAAFEPRIAAASVQGIFGSMRVSFIRDRNRHCRCGAIPGLLPRFDLPEMALLVAPRPIHFSNATADGFSPAEAKRCIKRITPLYQCSGGAAPKFSEPPGRHEYAFDPALKFFAQTIGKPE
jgi:glycerophosphoryl diester phosphodiesterase